MINEIPIVSGSVKFDKLLCNDTVDRLALIDIKGEDAVNPENGADYAWIPIESKKKANQAKLKTWDALEYITLHLSSVLRHNFTEFVCIQNVTDRLKAEAEKYYQIILEADGGVSRFTEILKILVEERVPIKKLETICKTYVELTRNKIPLYEIVEALRCLEKIRPKLPVNNTDYESCFVYKLGDEINSLIKNGIITNGDAALLALEPEPTQKILTAVKNEVANLPPTAKTPIIMTEDWRIRRYVRKLVELEFPYLAVMSEREITLKIETIATILLD